MIFRHTQFLTENWKVTQDEVFGKSLTKVFRSFSIMHIVGFFDDLVNFVVWHDVPEAVGGHDQY